MLVKNYRHIVKGFFFFFITVVNFVHKATAVAFLNMNFWLIPQILFSFGWSPRAGGGQISSLPLYLGDEESESRVPRWPAGVNSAPCRCTAHLHFYWLFTICLQLARINAQTTSHSLFLFRGSLRMRRRVGQRFMLAQRGGGRSGHPTLPCAPPAPVWEEG